MWRLEEKLLDHASSLRSKKGERVPDKVLTEILRSKPELSDDQVAVLKDLTQRSNGLRILEGVAGSGKTTVLDSVREAFERSGRRVIGGSLSGLATQNLAEGAQVPSRTVASYLYHMDKSLMHKVTDRLLHDLKQLARAAVNKPTQKHDPVRIPKRGVLIIDEAGMIDTKSMERLLYHARRAKATVILVGDRKQLQPIAAGGPFRFLTDKYTHVSLTENRRQRSKDDQIAVKQVRDGFTKQALESYLRRDLLMVTESRSDSARRIAKAWADQGGALHPKDHIILTETRREARSLNRICQAKRLSTGQLDPSSHLTADDNRFYRGDRILFLKPMRLRGIENGSRGTIVSINPSTGDTKVLLDHAKKGYPSTVVLSTESMSKDRVSLAYAGTVHKLQGQSTENAYVLLGGGMTDNNMAYTQLTRAKGTTQIFVDKAAAGEDLCRIAKRISRERLKTLAQEERFPKQPEIER
jgi:ATP-dependent exoDNAse (exonuclease V) alpha subunit